jgi:hypothetical protein
MKSAVRYAALIVLLVLSTACDSPPPGSPTPPDFSLPRQPPPANLPPLSGPSRTFIFDRELSYPVRDFTKQSRFVLYDNGAFELRYPHVADATYRGSYEEDDGVVAFSWGGMVGRLSNGELAVDFNELAEQADYEDAIYVLTP